MAVGVVAVLTNASRDLVLWITDLSQGRRYCRNEFLEEKFLSQAILLSSLSLFLSSSSSSSSRADFSLSLSVSLSSRSFFLLFSFVYFFPATFSCRLCTLHFPFTLRKPLLLLSSSSSSLSLSLSRPSAALLSLTVWCLLFSPQRAGAFHFFFLSFDSSWKERPPGIFRERRVFFWEPEINARFVHSVTLLTSFFSLILILLLELDFYSSKMRFLHENKHFQSHISFLFPPP